MRIDRLEVFSFPIPFKVVFRHSSASRAQAENVIVAAHSDRGQIGYGEGCPRTYVTGETVESCRNFIRRFGAEIIAGVGDVDDLRRWATEYRRDIDKNPAAFCAVELAILDLMGKAETVPIEDVLGVPRIAGTYQYTAVLGDSPHLAYWWQLRRYWKQGFRDFKIKVSGDLRRDRAKIGPFAKRTDPAPRVRLDANNLWASAGDCIEHINRLPYDFFAVEEPLQEGDLDGFGRVGDECGTKIILDESLLRSDQLDRLENADRWIANIRVSKMGGLIRSLEVAQKAVRRGIGIIVGAQVGETSILTRAGLTVATAAKPNLVASEGAFGTRLLQRDLTSPCLMFGDGGRLVADEFGLSKNLAMGLEVDRQALIPFQ